MPNALRAENIVPASDLESRAPELLRQVGRTHEPLVITQDGKAAGVLLSPAAFDRLSDRARLIAAVEEGLADERAGRVSEDADVTARMKARFGAKPTR